MRRFKSRRTNTFYSSTIVLKFYIILVLMHCRYCSRAPNHRCFLIQINTEWVGFIPVIVAITFLLKDTCCFQVISQPNCHLRIVLNHHCRKVSNKSSTLVGNKIVDHSDVVGASPVGAAPTTSSFSISHLSSQDLAKTATRRYENLLSVVIWCDLY